MNSTPITAIPSTNGAKIIARKKVRPRNRRLSMLAKATAVPIEIVAEPCAKAYLKYRERRRAESGRDAPSLPLPDFFIGAHAQVMGWPLATADEGRFRTYFPSVTLRTP